MHFSSGKQLKCLSDAVRNGDYVTVGKIIAEQVWCCAFLPFIVQDPYEVRRVKMPAITSADEPNIIASTSDTRLIGCLCKIVTKDTLACLCYELEGCCVQASLLSITNCTVH